MIKLMADSTCDLSQEILDRYDISLALFSVTMDGETYQDRIGITPDEFYSRMEKLATPPPRACPALWNT